MDGKSKPQDEIWTGERCYITELMNHVDNPEVSIARARVEAGITTELHSLSVAEWYVIESGSGLMQVGDDAPRVVAAGDVVTIPKNQSQRIQNTAAGDLIFLCVCTPRFSRECYTTLE